MPPYPSTARSTRRQQAFQALDDLGETLRGLSYARAAALAGTTVTYVNAWVAARGYTNVLVSRRHAKRPDDPQSQKSDRQHRSMT